VILRKRRYVDRRWQWSTCNAHRLQLVRLFYCQCSRLVELGYRRYRHLNCETEVSSAAFRFFDQQLSCRSLAHAIVTLCHLRFPRIFLSDVGTPPTELQLSSSIWNARHPVTNVNAPVSDASPLLHSALSSSTPPRRPPWLNDS